ncbi:discoidin domain-containing protein [Bacteroides pyogenes]|uniref:discoidin domain-containing protein n=1 Tax=Bacteroides pyogenes TaxID=310300 RepID=UPI001BA54864|nr:discoidin domain-containing protein [Bacteroides pyogenes]MBR8709161.1 hypothetical protein [Bacteroides pyogenes]MBR8717952.1 hypothetical protein [Bacteroides pyogenes]MBR8747433.1 hypothetical protein [Bacteroides pyogenes]MBR8757777.1 hypothetical protein [Bacteroides pyogenes]MBR8781032.1 hypothetical protein [Bacteroides pyogenes]
MKRKALLYILPAMSAMLVASCSQNLDYEGEYDVKSYYKGSDPRENLLSFDKDMQTVSLPFVGNVCLQEKAEVLVDVRATREVPSDEKLYFEVVSKNDKFVEAYQEKEFITVDKVSFEESSLILAAGKNMNTSKLFINTEGLKNDAVLPVKIKRNEDSQLRVSSNRSLQIVKIEGQQLVAPSKQYFELSAAVTKDGVKLEGEGKIEIAALTASLFSGYKAKLVRDDEIVKDYPGRLKGYEIAPDNMFPNFESYSFDNLEKVDLSFQVQNATQFKTAKKVVLPLKIVLVDKNGKQIDLLKNKGDVLVQIEYYESNVILTENEGELGTALSKDGWTISTTPSSSNVKRLLDGNEKGSGWYRYAGKGGKTDVLIDMQKSYSVQGFKFSNMPDSYPDPSPSAYHFFVSEDGKEWTAISGVIKGNTDQGSYLFKVLDEYKARYVKVELTSSASYVGLTEITVYGKEIE